MTVPNSTPTGVFLRKKTDHDQYQMISDLVMWSTRAPLLQRAWVVQELLLSPRTIHFEKDEIIWSCNETLCCSCSSFKPYTSENDNAKVKFAQALMADKSAWVESWEQVIRLYSRKGITIESDRLPALSGIAKRFQARNGSVYLAGLWESNLEQGLCWMTLQGSGDASRPSTYLAPSWSWCSVLASLHWPLYNIGEDESTAINVDILEASCTPSTIDPTGAVSSDFIRSSIRYK